MATKKTPAKKAARRASLPRIEDETEASVRSRDEVLDRAVGLLAVALKGVGAPRSSLDPYARKYEAVRKLTRKERAFWKKAKPTKSERATFSWRYEALSILLWSLGFLPKRGKPNTLVDPAKLGHILFDREPAKFRKDAKPRSARELLNFADLMYRYHWAIRDAALNGRRPPAGLNPDIVMEWDYAARWLVGYADEKWDDISLDT